MHNKPFLKWPGGKYRLRNTIIPHLPAGAKRLIEPFLGSGAIFLNTTYDNYLLADQNADLINLYCQLQKEGLHFIDYCAQFFESKYNTRIRYQTLRRLFNRTRNMRLKAALFLYLNRHGFNGLCRYNRRGEFNVPFGRYTKPFFPKNEMLFFYQHSQRAIFQCTDFLDTLQNISTHDAVYCDPPYFPLSPTASFTAYTAAGFDDEKQKALAEKAFHLAHQGITVLISNHDVPIARKIYKTASRRHYFDAQRVISCNPLNRKPVREVLAVFSPQTIRQRQAL